MLGVVCARDAPHTQELSSSSGNILDNEDLIATLDSTKTKVRDEA